MSNQKIFPARRCLCVCLGLLLMLGLTACGNGGQEPLRVPAETAEPMISIETVYGILKFPEELFENLHHTEVTEGSVAMEVFYMVAGEGEKELYRIYYADEQIGTLLGYLTTDSGEISVSYSICQYPDEVFASDDERELCHSMMDAFSVILDSILAAPGFSETRTVAPVGDREAKLQYWTVTLPENICYSETEENGSYCAEFYGEVSGERIDLYRIGLEKPETGNVLGLYTVEGVQKPVMIQIGDLTAYEFWPEENQITIYQMMDSLNTVVQTIVADENFTAVKPSP